jgi:hypothetical protein
VPPTSIIARGATSLGRTALDGDAAGEAERGAVDAGASADGDELAATSVWSVGLDTTRTAATTSTATVATMKPADRSVLIAYLQVASVRA